MADRGRYLPVRIIEQIKRLAGLRVPKKQVARECDISKNTVKKYWPPEIVLSADDNPPQPAELAIAGEWAWP